MKKYAFLILAIYTLLSCNAKPKSNIENSNSDTIIQVTKTYPLSDYQEDFNQMVKLLLKKHPQPYAFIDKDSLNTLIEEQYNKITETTSFAQFIWICQKVVTAIRCGHTQVWSHDLNNVPKSMVFPMNVMYVDSQLYIIDPKNNSDKLSAGDEILTINGVKAKKLKEEIYSHLSSDGFNETNLHEETNFLFKPFSSMFFNYPTSYNVSVLKNGEVMEINLKEAENPADSKTFLDNCENQLCFDTNTENKTAIITIRSFGYYKKRFPIFKSFIDSCFQHINENQISNLIIDLRNNSGGDLFCSSYLLEHIATKPYRFLNKDAKWCWKLKRLIQPNPNRFKKKPYILINGRCFSATGHFCSLVKENKFGIFIGDNTGGTYTCNDNSKIYTLKNTKVIFKVARNTYSTTASSLTNKHGITPDHYVIPSIDDYLNNRDTVLNYTFQLIAKKQLE